MNTQPQHVLSTSTLNGDSVINAQGEDLGEIKDIMVDTSSGKVEYAVLSFGGFLGMGDKLFAVPWNALQVDQQNKKFRLNVNKEELKEAPGFDKDNWPNFADSSFREPIDSFYSTRTVQ